MHRGRIVVFGLVLLLLLLIGAIVFVWFGRERDEVSDVASVAEPVVAPPFSFPNADGALVTLDSLDAPVRVITFWASWSPYSKQELVDLVALKRAHGDQIAIAALNRDVDPGEGKAFLEGLGLEDELMFAYDQNDTYFKEVGGFNMPETVFVSPEGLVLHHQHGPMTYEAMEGIVTRLLSEHDSRE